jgi:hypothetical protein
MAVKMSMLVFWVQVETKVKLQEPGNNALNAVQ